MNNCEFINFEPGLEMRVHLAKEMGAIAETVPSDGDIRIRVTRTPHGYLAKARLMSLRLKSSHEERSHSFYAALDRVIGHIEDDISAWKIGAAFCQQ